MRNPAYFIFDVQHSLRDLDESVVLTDDEMLIIDSLRKQGFSAYDTACQIEFNRAMIATE